MSPNITTDSGMRDLASLAMSLHLVTGMMPVVVKSRNGAAVIADGGRVKEIESENGPLERMFRGEKVACEKVMKGRYKGIKIFVSAIVDQDNDAVAAVGIIDTSGLISLKESMDISSKLDSQLIWHFRNKDYR